MLSYLSEQVSTFNLLNDEELKNIFKNFQEPKPLASAALNYLKTQNHLNADQKAALWIELTNEIHRRTPIFISYMFTGENHKYLFQGGFGETLFIDSDGTMYRTTMRVRRAGNWDIDYSTLTKLVP